jgi:hypothetical protein
VPSALVDGESQCLPDLCGEETIAEEVAALDDELFAFVAFFVAELGVVVAKHQPTEGDVPRLVLHDVGGDRLGQWTTGLIANGAERRERHAFDEDLHAEVGEVPARVRQRLVEQLLEVRIDGVQQVERICSPYPVWFAGA